MPTGSHLNIALSGDDNYAKYMAVTMQNVVQCLPKSTTVNFLVIDAGIKPQTIETLTDFVGSLECATLTMVNLADKYPEELARLAPYCHDGKENTISVGTYGLFFIAEAFPAFDKALYIDVDVIVRHDLSPAYATAIDDKYAAVVRMLTHAQLGATKSSRSGKTFAENFTDLYGKSSENYFNAGVQLLNLKKMRQEKVKDQLVKTLTDIPLQTFATKVEYHNQDIFNAVFCDKVAFLPLRFNCQLKNRRKIAWKFRLLNLDFAPYEHEFADPALIHYSGHRKPWKDKNLFASEVWWQAAEQTPFIDEIKAFYQQHRRRIVKTPKGFLQTFFAVDLYKNQRHLKLFGITLLRD